MTNIKIAIFGYGRAGKVIAKNLNEDARFSCVFAINKSAANTQAKSNDFPVKPPSDIEQLIETYQPDVIIDFTYPDAVLENITKLPANMAYVVATTGFSEQQITELKTSFQHLKLMLAPNISDGINILIKACELINALWGQADVNIIEQHFREKVDIPSGTAKRIARCFEQETPIHSIRAGNIVGVHEVVFASNDQKLTITHESLNKEVFAEGIKKAALWLMDKECGAYEVSEVYE